MGEISKLGMEFGQHVMSVTQELLTRAGSSRQGPERATSVVP